MVPVRDQLGLCDDLTTEFIEYAHRGYQDHGDKTMLNGYPFTVAVFTTDHDPDGVVVKLV